MRDETADPLARLVALEGVASAMTAARDGIDGLLRDRGLRRTSATTTTESLLLGVHASAELAGSSSTLDELRADGGDAVAAGVVRLQVELLSLGDTLDRSPLQALARMHVLVSGDREAGGRPGTPTGSVRLTGLATLLTRPTTAPALVLAAVAHAEVAAARPFGSHDGEVARALERLLLVTRGVDPTSLTVPEAGHRSLRAEYESTLRGYAAGGTAGVHAWLLYAAEAYAAGAEASPLRQG